ncbi:pilus assembly protein PilP [Thalassolituus marinus]|uniref:Pilus assembly protein PilP n=1 Tax=Thalassolituus marinus TaxID=671053 RepID=A0ABS7ZLY0_9GAMM|nr:pilus assembly protein PilP [Thalassolituus marinus]MCA6062729.1 pilus assembly protein PilP [Thalassolituus marinus]
MSRVLFALLPVLLMLTGCSGSSDTSDLKRFMDDTLSKPRGRVEPIPVFKPYEFFSYSAAGLRSPFELPVVDATDVQIQVGSDVKPDFERPKEHLEQYAMAELAMVGTLMREEGALWALVRDGDGGVVKVKTGQFMGQNHGRIVAVTDYKINLIEIVPNGQGGWIERPRTLALEGLGGE